MNQDIIRALSLSFLGTLAFSCLYPYRSHTLHAMGLKSSGRHEVIMLCYVMALFAILALKLWPVYKWEGSSGVWGNLTLLVDRPSWDTMLNLTPFGSIEFYRTCIDCGTSHLSAIIWNRIGNILAFLPIGFFPMLLFRKASWKNTILAGFALSLLTEVSQYFLMRYASIDDILLNTFGVLIGYALCLSLQKIFPRFVSSFKCTAVHTAKYL